MKELYVSDLDGTLLNSNVEISDTTVNIINHAIRGGLQFTVSTARTPTTALKLLEKIHFSIPIMMMNGVLIYDTIHRAYIKAETMNQTVVMTILGMIKLKGLDCFLYALEDDQFFAYYDSVDSKSLNYFRNERIMKYDKKFTEVADLSLVAGKGIIYCVLRETKDKLEGLYHELSVVSGIRAEFYRDIYSEEYYMLEIYSEKASKKKALEFIIEKGCFDGAIGFGDNLNDMGLIEACDTFYAVSNAHPEIQNMANAIIGSNDEDGVAHYIEQLWKR